MEMDQTFQQRWDFRRKDDDADSLSSGDEPAGKEHRLVPFLSSPENGEETDDDLRLPQVSQQKSRVKPRKAIAKKPKNNQKLESADKKSKQKSREKRKRKRNEKVSHSDRPPLMVDLKNFADSLLEDLKVTRKKMFAKMSKQIMKLTAPKPVLKSKPKARQQSGNGRKKPNQTCNGKSKVAKNKPLLHLPDECGISEMRKVEEIASEGDLAFVKQHQQQSSETSNMVSVSVLPLHQWSKNDGLKIINQSAAEGDEGNGAVVEFGVGRSHGLTECFDASSSLSNYWQ